MLYFLIIYGSLRLLVIVHKLIVNRISDWECLAGAFWGMVAAVSYVSI